MIRKLIFVVVLAVLVALLSVSAASADQPVFFGPFVTSGIGELDAANCGGFQVLDYFTTVVTIKRFFDNDGNRVRELIQVRATDTLTNSVTGKAFTEHVHWTYIQDVDANTLTVIGTLWKLTVPGGGAVFQSVGRITFNRATGEVLFEAGKWDIISGDYSGLCAALE
jgi:hypothetical protein